MDALIELEYIILTQDHDERCRRYAQWRDGHVRRITGSFAIDKFIYFKKEDFPPDEYIDRAISQQICAEVLNAHGCLSKRESEYTTRLTIMKRSLTVITDQKNVTYKKIEWDEENEL